MANRGVTAYRKAPVVAAMPARDEIRRLAQRLVEDGRRLDDRVVRAPIHHHLADDRPDPVGLGGSERGVEARLVDRAVHERGGGAGGRERPPRDWAPALRRRPRRSRARAGRCSGPARSAGPAPPRGRRSGAAAGARADRPSRAAGPTAAGRGRRRRRPAVRSRHPRRRSDPPRRRPAVRRTS